MNAHFIPEPALRAPFVIDADGIDVEFNHVETLLDMLAGELASVSSKDSANDLLLKVERCAALQSAIENKVTQVRGEFGAIADALNRRAAA